MGRNLWGRKRRARRYRPYPSNSRARRYRPYPSNTVSSICRVLSLQCLHFQNDKARNEVQVRVQVYRKDMLVCTCQVVMFTRPFYVAVPRKEYGTDGSKLTQKTCSFAHARYQCLRMHFLLQFLASMCMVLTSTIPAQPVGYRTHGCTPAYILSRWHTMQQAHLPIRAPKQGVEVEGTGGTGKQVEGTGKYVLSSTFLSDVVSPKSRAPAYS